MSQDWTEQALPSCQLSRISITYTTAEDLFKPHIINLNLLLLCGERERERAAFTTMEDNGEVKGGGELKQG